MIKDSIEDERSTRLGKYLAWYHQSSHSEEMESLWPDDDAGRRRDALPSILPLIEWSERQAPSSVISLLIISMFLPDEIVRIVEETVGWPDLHFGIPEGDQVLEMSPGNFRPLRRVVQALRDIGCKTLTPDIQYVMQNLQEYKTLLGRLLDELKHCREMRSPRDAQPPLNLPTRNPNDLPVPNTNDLTHHAGALEVLLDDLGAQEHVVILLAQLDQHIFTVHQLIEFLR